jgi:hypothetical protein
MRKVYKGIVQGNVIQLETQVELPYGTPILVSLKMPYNDTQEEIRNRQFRLLEKGFSLGKKLYSERAELYDR